MRSSILFLSALAAGSMASPFWKKSDDDSYGLSSDAEFEVLPPTSAEDFVDDIQKRGTKACSSACR